MKDKQILQGLREILLSLNEEELRQVIPAYILEKDEQAKIGQPLEAQNNNILGKISAAGVEKIKNAKDFISKKIKTDQGENKEEVIKKEKEIIADNPFLKYKKEHSQDFSQKNNG